MTADTHSESWGKAGSKGKGGGEQLLEVSLKTQTLEGQKIPEGGKGTTGHLLPQPLFR